MFYLVIFAVSLFLIFIGLKVNNKIAGKILVFLGLLVPCIVAGLRNYTVGTDTGGYILKLYNMAGTSISFDDFKNVAANIYNCKDMIYLFITYIFGHNGISFQLLLFLFEILIIFPIYFAIKKIRKNNADLILGMAIFYLTIFNLSMNMIRQAIAISFVLYSFSVFAKRKNWKSIVLSLLAYIVAIEFHDTALYIFPIFIFYFLLNSKKMKEKDKTVFVGVTIVISAAFVVFYKPILTFIGNIGIYPKALWYLNRYNSFDIDYTRTLLNIVIAFIIFYKREFFNKNEINYKFGLLVAVLNVIINFLGTFITYSDRIAYYLFYILIANYLAVLTKENTKSKYLAVGILAIFLVYWIIVILVNNGSQTLPYVMFK